MKKILFGILLVFFSLAACEKNDFDQNYGVNDLELKNAVALDEAGSAFAVGTHTFSALNLTKNRWGWANNVPITIVNGNEFVNTLSTCYLNSNVNGSIVNVGKVLINYDEQNLVFKIIFNEGYSFPETRDNTYLLTVRLSVPGSNWKIFQYNFIYTNHVYTNNEYIFPLSQIPSPGFTIGNPLYLIIEGLVNSNLQPVFLSTTINGGNVSYNTINTVPTNDVSEKTLYTINDGIWTIPDAFEIYNDGNFLYFNKIGTGFQSRALIINGISVYDTYNGQIAEAVSCKLALFQIPGYDGNGSTVNIMIEATNESHGGAVYASGPYTFNLGTPSVIGNKTFSIYSGAARNDTTKGTLVGKAIVTYDGTTAKIKYVLDEYTMNEVHIYASDTEPTTISPGQYGFTQTFETPVSEFETEFEVTDVAGDGIWLILHAVVNL